MNDYQKRRFSHKIGELIHMMNLPIADRLFSTQWEPCSTLSPGRKSRSSASRSRRIPVRICSLYQYFVSGVVDTFIVMEMFDCTLKLTAGDTRESSAAYVMKDLIDERANLAVYDPQVHQLHLHSHDDPNNATSFFGQVTRDQMFMEFDYTLNVNEQTVHGLHKMIENVPSAIEAATVRLYLTF